MSNVLGYATPTKPSQAHNVFDIAATAVFLVDMAITIAERPLHYPLQQRMEVALWLMGLGLVTVAAFTHRNRHPLFFYVSAALSLVTFFVVTLCLPSI